MSGPAVGSLQIRRAGKRPLSGTGGKNPVAGLLAAAAQLQRYSNAGDAITRYTRITKARVSLLH